MTTLALYLATGAVAGFFAGLLGVGGGIVMVPMLAMLFAADGLPPPLVFPLALGTSMAAIVFTSVSSLRTHDAHGAVDWPVVGRLTPGILAGTFVGSLLARHLPAAALVLFFAGFTVFVAVQMSLNLKPKPSRSLPERFGMAAVGAGIGVVSALAAIGGGAMTVPFLAWCNVPLRRAIGTSAAVGFPIAAGGTIGYVVNGHGAPGLPPWSLGFVYLPALAAVLATSVVAAHFGARVAQRLPLPLLRRIFATLLVLLAGRMLWRLFG